MIIDNKNEFKIRKVDFIIWLIFISLFIIAFLLIFKGLICDGVVRSLFIGLGSGVATSFLVSLVFYIIDKLIKKKESIRNRDRFIFDFKIMMYRTITSINFCNLNDGEYELQAYIKLQHRWYHDYYKKMEVGSDNKLDTKNRLDNLKQYIDSEEHIYESTFGYDYLWKKSSFTNYQIESIERIYLYYKNVVISIKNNNISRAFLDFSSLLECLKNVVDVISELSSFKLIKLNSKNGEVSIDYTDFEKEERIFKFAREFNQIRHNNNIQNYGKTKQGQSE